jgi:hypothetical protein
MSTNSKSLNPGHPPNSGDVRGVVELVEVLNPRRKEMHNVILPQNSGEVPFRPTFFVRPPFRSYFFVSNTLFLIATLSILVFVLSKYWALLPATSVYWLGLVGFCMMLLWFLALRCYRRIHELFQSGAASSVRSGSPLEVVMSSAAGMIHWGLFFGYFMTAAVLMQFANVLSTR